MPRMRTPFRRRPPSQSPGTPGTPGGGDDEGEDDMTITSGWSFGGSSVSDRIIGRMKMNLGSSFGSSRDLGGGGGRNQPNPFSSGASVGSRKSTGRFGGRRASAYRSNVGSGRSVDGGVLRSKSASRLRSSMSLSSSVGVEAMEEMDSNEAMALRGQGMGRRRSNISAPTGRLGEFRENSSRRFSAQGTLKGSEPVDLDEPMEYSLAELRSMSEEELKGAMRQSGVPVEDIAKTLEEAAKFDGRVPHIAEEQRKNMLVALFVNSGHVKLVSGGGPSSRSFAAERRNTALSSLSETRRTSIGDSDGHRRNSTLSSIGADADQPPAMPSLKSPGEALDSGLERRALSPLKQEPKRESQVSQVSAVSFDAGSVMSSKSDKLSRKSKLEKIAELKADNANMKRENKSLKKTVKKLLGQLSDAAKEKDELQAEVKKEATAREKLEKEAREAAASGEQQQQQQQLGESSDRMLTQDSEHSAASSSRGPPYNVLTYKEDDQSASARSRGSAKVDGGSRNSVSSDKSAKNVIYLKRKLKKEKEAHQNTEFRLKAEIDILTKEVEGIQRELGNTLENLDNHKRRARDFRDSASSAKHELRNANARVKELTAEAEARDRLIETFTRILLQKVVGLEDGDGDGGGEGRGILTMSTIEGLVGEGKVADEVAEELATAESEESIAALKVL